MFLSKWQPFVIMVFSRFAGCPAIEIAATRTESLPSQAGNQSAQADFANLLVQFPWPARQGRQLPSPTNLRRAFITFITALMLAACSAREAQVTPTPLGAQPASPPVDQVTPAAITEQGIWQPAPGITWQWQFADLPVDTSVDAEVYDIDLVDNEASVVAALHAQGRKVICYLNAGSWEDWRPDKDQFPPEVIGKDYAGWPGEKWLDIRQIDKLAPLLRARLDLCRDKGFDGVEPDNIDAYTNDTGFPLTYQDQLRYNIWLADEAHALGLSIGLKNDSEQTADLLFYFDWALTEDCFDQGWCEQLTPFIEAGKAVIDTEYTDTGIKLEDFCAQARAMQVSAILKHRDLDAFIQTCP